MAFTKADYEASLEETLRLLREGRSLPEIAFKRKLAFSTIESHLRQLLGEGRVELGELLGQGEADVIANAIAKADAAGETGLRGIKSRLPDGITYGQIRYVLTSMGRTKPKQTMIRTAIKTYAGNYCFRKCFRHNETIRICMENFDRLEGAMGNADITFKELKGMIDSGDIKICGLPPEKRRRYVSWAEFEKLLAEGKDFWDDGV